MTTFQSAVETYGNPDFCKVDVEGFEVEVLRGMSSQVRTVTFEFTNRRLADAVRCLDHLASLGSFQANLTPEDEPRFLSDRWLSHRDVIDLLNDPATGRYAWGDIFVCRRTQP
jgi:hypothetical protein